MFFILNLFVVYLNKTCCLDIETQVLKFLPRANNNLLTLLHQVSINNNLIIVFIAVTLFITLIIAILLFKTSF